ncbi:MAG TPA: phosphatidate cytidylyltransferase [Polyangia bacterium]|nr:phosphatidate cytidylyltransferase [Polyangia bacterium]
MSNLAARLLTAAVLIPVLVVAIRWSNPVGVWAVVYLATFLGLREFYNMTMAKEPLAERGFAIALGLGFAAVVYWLDGQPMAVTASLAAMTLLGFLFYLFRYRTMETVAARVTAMLAGTLYVGLLLTFVALLKKRGPDGGAWVYITLTVTWFGDTGAYFAGRFIGPAWPVKLYESVSPKKTIIGALGGLAGSFGAMVLAKLWYLPSLSWTDCALVALPAGALGQMGDLCESMLKRSVGVKDSGKLLPGHGGMLDRIDALLFSVPYIYCYARWLYGHL